MEKRLVVFGPSSSYGMGLDSPDEEAWGGVLASLLKRKLVNNSIPGASNKLIAYKATTYTYQPDDIVIIAWAYVDRYSVIQSDTEYINFMPSDTNEESLNYYKYVHNDFDHIFMSRVYINYTINYLSWNGVDVKSLFNSKPDYDLQVNQYLSIPIIVGKYFVEYPLAKDGMHVGKLGHKALGEVLFKFYHKSVI